MGSRARRLWKESKNAESHSLPVTTGEHVILTPCHALCLQDACKMHQRLVLCRSGVLCDEA